MDFAGVLNLSMLSCIRDLHMVCGLEVFCGCLGRQGHGDIRKWSAVWMLFFRPTVRNRSDSLQRETSGINLRGLHSLEST